MERKIGCVVIDGEGILIKSKLKSALSLNLQDLQKMEYKNEYSLLLSFILFNFALLKVSKLIFY